MIEIGDKFIINWKYIKSIYPYLTICKDPYKEFVAKRFTKSKISIYFDDNRTNKKCKCQICIKSEIEKSIGVSYCILTIKRIAIERHNKLKKLGI
jgi:hypothetical protein